jgi:hypothetical protein
VGGTRGFFLSSHTIDGWPSSYGCPVVFVSAMAESRSVPVPG